MLKLTVCTWCQILRGWQLEPQIIPNNELQVRAKNFIERSILDDKRIFLKIWLKIFPWNFSPWPKNFTKIWEKTPFFLFLKLTKLYISTFLNFWAKLRLVFQKIKLFQSWIFGQKMEIWNSVSDMYWFLFHVLSIQQRKPHLRLCTTTR